jgi:acetyl-CoA acetyltransferase
MNKDGFGLRDKTAVCGVGLKIGATPGSTELSLAADAFKLALADSGLTARDIDGFIAPSFGADYDRVLESWGVDVRFAFQGWTHGRFVSPTLQHAAMVVASGQAKSVAVVFARKRKPHGGTEQWEMWRQGLGPHGESPAYGAVAPVFGAAMSMQRYFHIYGGEPDALAPIAIAARKHAGLNPIALKQEPMELEHYVKSRWIVEPLRLFDCCLVNEAAACVIVTSAERARDLAKPPVYISGFQGVHAGPQYHNLALPGLGVAQQKVFRFKPQPEDLHAHHMAGITVKDIDAVMTYDAFTPLVVFGLERFGFCEPGGALDFIKNGGIELGGKLPVNTSGGLLSEGHASGWNLIIEAIRQARRECGPRQVKDLNIVQYGGFLGEAVIFRR